MDAFLLLYRVILVGAPILFVAVLIMQPRVAEGSRFPLVQRAFGIAAVGAAVIPGAWLLVSGTLSSDNGWVVLIDLSIPIGLTLASVVTRVRERTLCTAAGALMLAICCILGALSIGPFYTPAATLLIVAGAIGLVPRPSQQTIGRALGHVP